MGILDSIFGGGSQSNTTELPDWLRRPSSDVATNIRRTFINDGRPPLNQQQNDALTAIENQARQGNPLIWQGQDVLGQLFGSGGLSNNQSWLADALAGGGFDNPATGMAGFISAGGLNDANPALAETARVAMGGDVGNNPYLEKTFARAADAAGQNFRENVIPGMDRGALSQGRLGSNAYAAARNNAEDAYGRQINDLATNIYGGAYESDMGRKAQALGQYGALGQEGINTQLQGLGMFGDLSSGNVQQRLQGAGLDQQGIANLFSGMGSLEGLQNLRYDDLQRLFGTGTTREDARYAEANRAGAALSGLPGSGTGTNTQAVNPNPYAQLVGLGTAALSAWAASDRRLKTDIERTGETPAGLPTYSFRYLWDDPGVVRHGVMAHEVKDVFPDAVAETPEGWLAVDYARIG